MSKVTIQLKANNHNLTTSVTIGGKKHIGVFSLEAVLARLIELMGQIEVNPTDGNTIFVHRIPVS